MLTEAEYNALLPYKETITARNMNKAREYLTIADAIRQRLGMGHVCYSCDGSKIEAINDIINLFNEYEQSRKTPNV